MPPKKKEETVASSAPSDDTDVQPAIDSETQDGKGDDPVPESDFSSYATAGVEKEDLKPVPVIVHEVLNGFWGNFDVLRDRLEESGYNSTEVITQVNDRLTRGAPSAYKPNALQLADQVARGEWGEEKGLRQRIEKAGFTYIDVLTQIRRRPQ